jgi:hypothetical protein
MEIYCVKCKTKTPTLNPTFTVRNGKNMVKGLCTVCNKYKTSFVKGPQTGTGLNDIINKLPIELHLYADKGEYVPGGNFNDQQKYSFCGPGTRYEQRVREGYKGINELDSTCLLHDKFYNENTDTKTRNISDIALAHRADEIAMNQSFDGIQRRDASLISGIMKTKAKLGLGMQAKN